MTFWEHLDELRKILFRSALAIVLFMIVIFFNKDFVFNKIVFAPINSDFILYRWMDKFLNLIGLPALEAFNIELINIELSAQFFTHLSTSFYLGLIITTPYIFYLIWKFVAPALYDKERGVIQRAFGFSSILFFMGISAGYLFVFPLTLRFLGTYQVSDWVANQISLQSYISMFTWLILIMGIVFEMPTLALILSKLGIINKSMLKKYRRYAFISMIILAAIITPSGDAFTLFIVGLPLYMLYEFSILVCSDINK